MSLVSVCLIKEGEGSLSGLQLVTRVEQITRVLNYHYEITQIHKNVDNGINSKKTIKAPQSKTFQY